MSSAHFDNDLSASRQCYFTIQLPHHPHPRQATSPHCQSNHWSDETPLSSPTFDAGTPSTADPVHPLLAYRQPASPSIDNMSTSSFMQRQTTASHPKSPSGHRHRPSLQNVLHVTSDDSMSSSGTNSSSSIDTIPSSPDFARCSRCQRTPSIDYKTAKTNMIQYGLNLWYCTRCAAMVGLQIDR